MAPRAYWKGYLKLSLVSCPIALYPAASSSERVSFNRINIKTGNRLEQQLVDAETGETVEKEDIGRGYEIGFATGRGTERRPQAVSAQPGRYDRRAHARRGADSRRTDL
jgi:DNA end-binding protein Ku